jgi:hypothetical protein
MFCDEGILFKLTHIFGHFQLSHFLAKKHVSEAASASVIRQKYKTESAGSFRSNTFIL